LSKRPEKKNNIYNLEISDKDIHDAMKDIPGYLDITTGDFKELYRLAYRHSLKRITQSIKAGDIMTIEVIAVKRQTPLKEVAELMAEQGVSGVPVIEEDRKVAGIISEKDFLSQMGAGDAKTFMDVVATCLKGKGCVALSIRAKNAEDIMTSPAVSVNEETTLLDITNILKEKRINRVPVIDSEGHLTGIVSRADIVEAPFLRGIS
jgi:CBS domain-containing membrane protein